MGASAAHLIDAILIERRKELWGEGFGLADIIRSQLPVVRKPYVNANGADIPVTNTTPAGVTKQVPARYHSALRFSDQTPFVANSPFYVFAVPQAEEQNNPNLNRQIFFVGMNARGLYGLRAFLFGGNSCVAVGIKKVCKVLVQDCEMTVICHYIIVCLCSMRGMNKYEYQPMLWNIISQAPDLMESFQSLYK